MSPDPSPLSGKAVLIVEDEVFIAMALEDCLSRAGARTVDSAMTLEAAYERTARATYDVAVLDVRLQDSFCHEFARDLIAKEVPIVFHSGHADADFVKDFPGSYFCDKPSTADTVIRVVEEAIGTD